MVPNGVDAERYIPGPKPVALEERHGLKGKFVAAYVGTVGLAHGLQVLLECASALRHRDDIAFVIVGTGAQRQELEQRCKDEGLTNVVFVGAVSKDEVVLYWKLCDVALVLLRDSPLFAHVLPSKMFEAMGMARPIILGVRGESKDVLEKSGGGIAISPENCDELRGAIERLADDPALGAQLGVAGRKFVLRDYNRDTLASQMLDVLAKAAKRQ